MKIFLILLSFCSVCYCVYFANETIVQNKQTLNIFSDNNLTTSRGGWTDSYDEDNGVWSKLLEDYTLRDTNYRKGRVIPGNHRYIPASNIYITKRIGEAMELEPHMRPPGKVISPAAPMPPHHSQSLPQPPNYPNRQSFIPSQSLREVSETDLYLLGAIEKLVFRVDYMENRLRRTEQIVYYLMAGNNQKEEIKFCPKNFTRIGDRCYHFGGESQINWKTGNSICKSMSANLAEFEDLVENEEVIAYLLNHPGYRGKDFWLGGLNPGLLWIWANSAKPVNPNTNLTTVANSFNDSKNSTNSFSSGSSNKKGTKIDHNKILNNAEEIKGTGRCLRLSYNPSKHTYVYYGQECTSRHHYLCEYQDKSLDNKIKKIARELNLF